jgi:hypothetical protein
LAYTRKDDHESGISQENSTADKAINPPESAFMIKAHRSSSRKRNNRANREANKDKDKNLQVLSDEDETIISDARKLKIIPITPIIVESDSELRSSDTQSPVSTLEKGSTLHEPGSEAGLVSLTLPFSKGKNTALVRSHSSASVFLSKAEHYRNTTPSPGSHRQKDLVKRRPHVLDHLGPAVGTLDKSSHKRDTSWTTGYFPSLEPIYAQSSLSLFDGALEEKVSFLFKSLFLCTHSEPFITCNVHYVCI